MPRTLANALREALEQTNGDDADADRRAAAWLKALLAAPAVKLEPARPRPELPSMPSPEEHQRAEAQREKERERGRKRRSAKLAERIELDMLRLRELYYKESQDGQDETDSAE